MFFEKRVDDKINVDTQEWVWVEGYKGTDKNMCCRDFQYDLGQIYEKNGEIKECENGFHLCLELKDVFDFYDIGLGNRFFKVRALVRKENVELYGCSKYGLIITSNKKLVAKSIEFISELSVDEVCDADEYLRNLDKPYKELAFEIARGAAIEQYEVDTLIKFGYAEQLATYIARNDRFDIAYALGFQKDLSMDVKIPLILNGR